MGLDPVFHSVRQELEGGDETVLGPGSGGPTWGSLAELVAVLLLGYCLPHKPPVVGREGLRRTRFRAFSQSPRHRAGVVT